MLEFTFISGPERGKTLTFDAPPITIGRHPSNKLQIKSPFISSTHGKILIKKGRYIYTDLQSKNGTHIRHKGLQTLVDGKEVTEHPLESGDELIFCNVILSFKHDTPQQTITQKPIELPSLPILLTKASSEQNHILQDLKQDNDKLSFIYEFLWELETKNTFNAILEITIDTIFTSFPSASHSMVVMVERDGKLKPVSFKSRKMNYPPESVWKSIISQTIIKKVIKEDISLLFSGENKQISNTNKDSLDTQINSGICVPLKANDKIMGAIQIDNRVNKDLFTEDDLNFLMIIARHMALSLHRLRLNEELKKSFESVIATGAHTLDMRDSLTAGHSVRVQMYAIETARAMGLSPADIEKIKYASIVHDFGKVAIPDSILKSKGELSDEEYAIIRKHASYTKDILDKVFFPEHLSDVPVLAAYHHERLDGKGPLGIKGDDIPLISKIIAVADVFDALTSARTYKETMSMKEAAEILIKDKGIAFDPEVVDTFLKRFNLK